MTAVIPATTSAKNPSRARFGGSTHSGKAHGGDAAGFQNFSMGEVAGVVQDDIGVQLYDLIDVQIALGVNGVAGLHQLRGDILQHRVRNDRLEGAAVAHRRKQAKKRQSPVSKDCRP